MAFLNRLGRRYDTVATVKDGKLLFVRISGAKTAWSIFVHGGIVVYQNYLGPKFETGNPELEEWLLDTAGEQVPSTVKKEIKRELAWLWFSYSHILNIVDCKVQRDIKFKLIRDKLSMLHKFDGQLISLDES